MFKGVEPKKRSHRPARMGAYVRLTPRMFYISGAAGKMWGMRERCNISIDAPNHLMVISPGNEWKLSTVCETENAMRIETRNSAISFLDAGFPKGMLGKYLPCHVDMAGSLIVSLMVDYDRVAKKVE